ncbi:amidohydrolase family protein [Roseibacterium beibuensis]|uniref:amidohydrolase family protein n=1 Tax=[Roseibacterium] beibuensis TaxID=1193142 RepID=UPI00217DEC3E|nr:amidohydrolase family protein [Roseibacterium beibuensis]MCS6625408.1 amidohydrolase family protein [Roseibacterium beibuensis]
MALVFTLCAAGTAWAEPLTLRNVRIASAVADSPSPQLSRIHIEGDRIVSIEPEHDGPVDGASIDGERAFASPGLWGMHIHALTDLGAATRRTLPLLVSHGVTGIRDMGSVPVGIEAIRGRLEADPTLPRPRLFVSGPLLDGHALPWYGDLPLVLTTPEAATAAVGRLKAQGMDFLKIYSDLKPEVLDAIAAEAQRLDMPTAGHVTRLGGLEAAARIRQSSIEHLSVATFLECLPGDPGFFDRWVSARFESYDAFWDLILDFEARADWTTCEARLRALAAAGAVFTPTLAVEFLDRERTNLEALTWLAPRAREWCELNLARVEAADLERRNRVYDAYIRMLARVRSAGIPIMAGSDAPNFCLAPGSSLHGELERLVEAGMTPAEAVAAATIEPAKLMGRSQDMGRVAPGYVADIVLTASNPFMDVGAYRDIRWVVAAGRVYDEAALDRMRQAAAASLTAD